MRVFERFYRADASGSIPGTGLGMSLVKEIVEIQGGEVEVHSRIGEGTCISLWFAQHTGLPLLPVNEANCAIATTDHPHQGA